MDAVDLDAVQAQLIQPILHLMGPAALYACKDLDEAAAEQALKHFVVMCELPSQRSSHSEFDDLDCDCPCQLRTLCA